MGKNAKRIRAKMLREAMEADRPENWVHPKQCLLPPEFIHKIRAVGLFIDDFPSFVSGHVGTPSGYSIILPAEIGGNHCPGLEIHYTDTAGNEAKTLMPSVVIWGDGVTWKTEVHEWVPGPGPGDFSHEHNSLEAAYDDIISYFFNPLDTNFQALVGATHD